MGFQSFSSTGWVSYRQRIDRGESNVNWCPRLLSVVDASFAKVSWDDFQTALPSRPFALTHGDFHANNMMIRRDPLDASGRDPSVVLLDFEFASVACGAGDLASFMISHIGPSPEVRRQFESQWLRTYHSKLRELIPSDCEYTFEKCKADYVECGLAWRIYILGLMVQGCDEATLQFNNDLMSAFIRDHDVTEDTVPMAGTC